MSRLGTRFTKKREEQDDKLVFPFPPPKKQESEDKQGKSDDAESILSEDVKKLKAEIDENAMTPLDGLKRQKSILSSSNTEAMNADRAYVSPTSEEFEEVLDNPVGNKEEELVSKNRMIFFGIVFVFLYAAFLGVGAHFTTIEGGVPQRITMEDRRSATFLSDLDPYVFYIQTQHSVITDSSDAYTDGTMSADELSETMKQAKTALGTKKKELVDMTAPQEYEGMKSKIIELYSVQMTYCDNVVGFLSNQSERNLAQTREANKAYEEKAQDFFDMYNQ